MKIFDKIKNVIFLFSRKIAWKFGFVLLPIEEINYIERDGIYYAHVRNKYKEEPRIYNHFHGISDYALKKAANLRNRYFTN
jgi:hypothetical protein